MNAQIFSTAYSKLSKANDPQISCSLSDDFDVELDVIMKEWRRLQHIGDIQFQQFLLSGNHQAAHVCLLNSNTVLMLNKDQMASVQYMKLNTLPNNLTDSNLLRQCDVVIHCSLPTPGHVQFQAQTARV